jgi:hypothetical protein
MSKLLKVTEPSTPKTALFYYKEQNRLLANTPPDFHKFVYWYMNEHYSHTNSDEQIAGITDLVDNLGRAIAAYALTNPTIRPTCKNKLLMGKK